MAEQSSSHGRETSGRAGGEVGRQVATRGPIGERDRVRRGGQTTVRGSVGARDEVRRGGHAAVRGPVGWLPSPPQSSFSAVPGVGPEGPPGSCAAAPGLLECRRCGYLRTGRGEWGGRRPRERPDGFLPGAAVSLPSDRGPTSALPLSAWCQVVEVLLAVLLLACTSVSGSSTGGYTGLPSLGGVYYYHFGGAYSGFSGADGEKAQQLDQRFYLQKLPIARAAMAVGGCLLVFSCLLILLGVLRLPWHFPTWLLIECILDIVIVIGMVPALYYFFHFLLGVYNSSVCKEREQLYQSKGYQGFRCSLHGAEIATGFAGCIAIMAYLLSAGLAVRGYRTVHKLKQKPVQSYQL
ncbi:MARVEL domain-containing protein 3 [Indicator indicator]|uniref:MARVEL domain-containing protein 3 n=1 Tax=Indicator indicator TaxID=1002788 RepID=UPI0023E013AF|nr:MARVEL domain-containing protein 3 [Indicator indicator]